MRNRTRFMIGFIISINMILMSCTRQEGGPGPVATELVPVQIIPTEVILPNVDTLTYFGQLVESLPAGQGYGIVQPEALKAEMDSGTQPFLLDVRDASIVESVGFIEGAVNIPLRELLKNLDKLPAMETPIVAYDTTGSHAGMALAALKLLGYTDVHIIGGGFSSWHTGLQFPVVTGSKPEEPQVLTPNPVITDQPLYDILDAFLSNLPDDHFITNVETISTALTSGTPPVIFDVRTAQEREEDGYIESSVHIEFNNFFDSVDQLPAMDAPIVIYSGGGGRASIIVMGLRQLGYTNVYNLDGGMHAWIAAGLPFGGGGSNQQP